MKKVWVNVSEKEYNRIILAECKHDFYVCERYIRRSSDGVAIGRLHGTTGNFEWQIEESIYNKHN